MLLKPDHEFIGLQKKRKLARTSTNAPLHPSVTPFLLSSKLQGRSVSFPVWHPLGYLQEDTLRFPSSVFRRDPEAYRLSNWSTEEAWQKWTTRGKAHADGVHGATLLPICENCLSKEYRWSHPEAVIERRRNRYLAIPSSDDESAMLLFLFTFVARCTSLLLPLAFRRRSSSHFLSRFFCSALEATAGEHVLFRFLNLRSVNEPRATLRFLFLTIGFLFCKVMFLVSISAWK